MSATYWVAKHVPDPFRGEPRNVGVIVSSKGRTASRFIGEKDDGHIDGRVAKAFAYPDVYRQWVTYWKGQLSRGEIATIEKAATAHFYIQAGGEVSDVGSDTSEQVCQFLFSLLVSNSTIIDTFKDDDQETDIAQKPKLFDEIEDAFADRHILANGALASVRHPVLTGYEVRGTNTVHRPAFVQKNGKLFVYEVIDFTQRRYIKERSGFVAYMFSDIRDADSALDAYTLVKFSDDMALGEARIYARDMLTAESTVVNWADANERRAFLDLREGIARQ